MPLVRYGGSGEVTVFPYSVSLQSYTTGALIVHGTNEQHYAHIATNNNYASPYLETFTVKSGDELIYWLSGSYNDYQTPPTSASISSGSITYLGSVRTGDHSSMALFKVENADGATVSIQGNMATRGVAIVEVY